MEYNIYIDEAGDEGINKGSKYFILTALVVEKIKDLKISKSVDEIKSNLNIMIKSQLHWKSLKGLSKKMMILKTVSTLDITIINVIVDTKSIKQLPSDYIYAYFSGYLYERICWVMQEKDAVANINVSSRGNLSKEKLYDFLQNNNHKKFEINMTKIKQIKIIPNERKKLLQLADCCCSSLFQALKYHNKVHFNYVVIIKSKLYTKNFNLISYGLKFVPKDSNACELKELLNYLQIKK